MLWRLAFALCGNLVGDAIDLSVLPCQHGFKNVGTTPSSDRHKAGHQVVVRVFLLVRPKRRRAMVDILTRSVDHCVGDAHGAPATANSRLVP
jgi:hypothetical protein